MDDTVTVAEEIEAEVRVAMACVAQAKCGQRQQRADDLAFVDDLLDSWLAVTKLAAA